MVLKKQPGPAWERCGLEGSSWVLDPPFPEAGLLQGFSLPESKLIASFTGSSDDIPSQSMSSISTKVMLMAPILPGILGFLGQTSHTVGFSQKEVTGVFKVTRRLIPTK